MVEEYTFDRHLYPEFYDCYNADEIPDFIKQPDNHVSDDRCSESIKGQIQPLDGPMDSSWSMYCHDVRHTGRSPYSTVDTWGEIWIFETKGWADSSPVIDKNGTIYIGAYRLYVVYPNGTLKWDYNLGNIASCSPTIDENGIIYVGTAYVDTNLYAIYPNGTLKWKYKTGNVFSSPAIGDDGSIYFGQGDGSSAGYINALYSNSTLRWRYQTGKGVYSSPAIGLDGTIYCGSHDNNVYALYSNNGTLKWKFKTGAWVHGSPTIADDGTVYIGSDDNYLYALYPNNGTLKWKVNIGATFGSVALDKDGTIYVGVWQKRFYAIYPNGTIKWSFNTGSGKVWGSSPALSDDNTIYFGTCDLEWTGGIEIIALYTDGTVKWRKGLDTVFSSPAIGKDGTVYIGSCSSPGYGYLNAFGVGELEADANGPYYGLVDIPVQFESKATGGYSPHSYHWDFGDTHTSDEQNPLHTYTAPGNYTVILTVTDDTGNTSDDITWAWIQDGNSPPDKPMIDGQTHGIVGVSYDYTFSAIDPDENDIWYHIGWGDKEIIYIYGPYQSGKEITLPYTWSEKGIFTITCWARDVYDEVSETATLEVTMPRNRAMTNLLLMRFLEQFPILTRLLSLLK